MRSNEALQTTRIYGVETNRDYLRQIIDDHAVRVGRTVDALSRRAALSGEHGRNRERRHADDRAGSIRDVSAIWAVGIPPSGPMDDRALRLGNRLLDNAADAAALEITMSGPTLRFNTDAVVAVTGATLSVLLDEVRAAVEHDALRRSRFDARARHDSRRGRACLSVRARRLRRRAVSRQPQHLHARPVRRTWRARAAGGRRAASCIRCDDERAGAALATRPALETVRTLRVIYGPHGAPEYFSPRYIEQFFDTEWEIHFNSSRTGVRLIGPKPEWTREDGGEAGLHPSNIHDNPYAVGAVDFTGDMPVILGPGRPEPRRLRVSGDDHRGGPVADRPVEGGRQGALRAGAHR